MLASLDDYDWREAFGYAGEQGTDAGGDGAPTLAEGARCSADPFCREDVTTIFYSREGRNDGPSWLMIGQLQDGRLFYLEAGCDYTGWDCQADGSAWVAESLDHLLRWGITQEARDAFGLTLPALTEARE